VANFSPQKRIRVRAASHRRACIRA
jgi:hypothetical protein